MRKCVSCPLLLTSRDTHRDCRTCRRRRSEAWCQICTQFCTGSSGARVRVIHLCFFLVAHTHTACVVVSFFFRRCRPAAGCPVATNKRSRTKASSCLSPECPDIYLACWVGCIACSSGCSPMTIKRRTRAKAKAPRTKQTRRCRLHRGFADPTPLQVWPMVRGRTSLPWLIHRQPTQNEATSRSAAPRCRTTCSRPSSEWSNPP